MTEIATNKPMRTCAWCEENHPEHIRYWFGMSYLYFCSDLCINEWGELA